MTEIVLGPPGCGKTTTLINIVEEEITRGTRPERICYVSFTRKAAGEATSRAQEKFGLKKSDFPFFSTLHALCYRSLGVKDGDVLEGKTAIEFGKYAGVEVTGKTYSDDGTRLGFNFGDRIMFMENLARARGIDLADQYREDDDGLPWSEVDRVARALKEYKHDNGLIDFTDMLSQFVRSRVRIPIDVLLVDEAQDLSRVQWQVVKMLATNCRRVVVAGDDDQAIYRWAGADVDHLIDMDGDVRVLGQSYRVPPAVQVIANEVIVPVKHRREKQWSPRLNVTGTVERGVSFANIAIPKTGSVLVLARNAYVLREQVIGLLRRKGAVWEQYGHSSINMKLVAAARMWERLRRNEGLCAVDVRCVYEFMTSGRGVKRGHKTLPNIEDDVVFNEGELRTFHGLIAPSAPWFEVLDRVPKDDITYVRAALQSGENLDEKPRITLSTIHSAKGGEADHVIIMKEMASRTYNEMLSGKEGKLDDERRVWYVAATRAREKLTLVESRTSRRCPWL